MTSYQLFLHVTVSSISLTVQMDLGIDWIEAASFSLDARYVETAGIEGKARQCVQLDHLSGTNRNLPDFDRIKIIYSFGASLSLKFLRNKIINKFMWTFRIINVRCIGFDSLMSVHKLYVSVHVFK